MDPQTTDLLKSDAGGKFADLISRLAGPLADEVGMMLGDTARVFRMKNWVKTLQKTEQILKQAGLSPKAVPPRLFLPITEACSIEDNESLQDKWAGLLATASQETDTVSPAFVETLKQLTPDEARYLDGLYDSLKSSHVRLSLVKRPISPYAFSARGDAPANISADIYERLGLIRRDYDVKVKIPTNKLINARSVSDALRVIDDTEAELRYQFLMTGYAVQFLEACHGPQESTASGS